MTTPPALEAPLARPVAAPSTLEQVAARAGVSLKTASRALNGERHVADATRARVQDAAKDLGFSLNRVASMLARGIRSEVVALVTGDLANPFYSALAKGIELELRARGAQLTVASSDEDPDRERDLIQEQVSRQVRALVLVSTVQDHQAMRAVQDRGIPVVFVDRAGVGLDADSVVIDNRGGSEAATAHLIRGGHREVGFIGDLTRLPTHRERFLGFVDTMRGAGLDPLRHARHDAHSVQAAREAAHSLLSRPDPPSALFTSNNRITVGALEALRDLGAEPAIVGFDDFELADLLGISVVCHDPVEMGRTAARLALERVEHRRSDVAHVVVETRLVPRGSGER